MPQLRAGVPLACNTPPSSCTEAASSTISFRRPGGLVTTKLLSTVLFTSEPVWLWWLMIQWWQQHHSDDRTISRKIYYGVLWSWYISYLDVREDGSGWNLPYKIPRNTVGSTGIIRKNLLVDRTYAVSTYTSEYYSTSLYSTPVLAFHTRIIRVCLINRSCCFFLKML